jgi:hypothetical protein
VERSDSKTKKYTATFMINGKQKKVSFGQRGADDYTITKDKEQRSRYRKRHAKDLLTKTNKKGLGAGSLAYHILWGSSTSLQQNIKDYKKRFKL